MSAVRSSSTKVLARLPGRAGAIPQRRTLYMTGPATYKSSSARSDRLASATGGQTGAEQFHPAPPSSSSTVDYAYLPAIEPDSTAPNAATVINYAPQISPSASQPPFSLAASGGAVAAASEEPMQVPLLPQSRGQKAAVTGQSKVGGKNEIVLEKMVEDEPAPLVVEGAVNYVQEGKVSANTV